MLNVVNTQILEENSPLYQIIMRYSNMRIKFRDYETKDKLKYFFYMLLYFGAMYFIVMFGTITWVLFVVEILEYGINIDFKIIALTYVSYLISFLFFIWYLGYKELKRFHAAAKLKVMLKNHSLSRLNEVNDRQGE